MQILLLATQWGAESLRFEDFISRSLNAGYDGIDTWVPESALDRRNYRQLLDRYKLPVVCHQHQATGNSITEFCRSFEYHLNLCMEWEPILINSHSGRDFFSLDEQLRVLDVASEFSARNNITVAHETHRGRIGYSPYNSAQLFALRPELRITADLSHWVCVTESFLENCSTVLFEAMAKTSHVHARVGFTQGPQVPDPRVAEWAYATNIFLEWWLEIIRIKEKQGMSQLTITPEFGPPPYMPTLPATGEAVSDQFALNNYIKGLIKDTNAR